MARRTEPLPAFPRELADLGWTLIKAQGVNAVRAVNSRLHCTSPNFASDGRAWAKQKAERAAAKGMVPELPHVRAEIVEWARSITGIATPLVAALDRAVPDGEEAPRPFLFWSVTTTGPGGAAITVSAGYTRWFPSRLGRAGCCSRRRRRRASLRRCGCRSRRWRPCGPCWPRTMSGAVRAA